MPLKRKQFNWKPDLFEYTLSDEFTVYDVDTADVLDQLLKHMQGLFLCMSGGPGRFWMSILESAYQVDLWDEQEERAFKQRLIDDCNLLTAAVADMMECTKDEDRHAIFMEVHARVPWLNLPSDEARNSPPAVATA